MNFARRSSESADVLMKADSQGGLTKLLRIMRLTAIFLLGFGLSLSARTVSQTVTFSAKNVPLQTAFKAIEKQTGFMIFCTLELLEKAAPVSVTVKNEPLELFLEKILGSSDLSWVIEDKTISIKERGNGKFKLPLLAETPPITGVVRGPDGQPIAGVNVVVKGTKRGVTTDASGRFSIEAEQGKTLVISNIGYTAREIKVNGENNIIVGLDRSISQLDEVQYIAYGKSSPRFQTGNVASVKGRRHRKTASEQPLANLTGRVPGLFITQVNGLPGGGIKVRIQGQNSFINGAGPLYVVDGVPYPSELPPVIGLGPLETSGEIESGTAVGSSGNALSLINSADIESIEILKDAAATAICGSHGANGVILYPQKGKAGKMTFDFNLQKGWGKVARKLDMLTAQQYVQMRKEAYYQDSIADPMSFQSPNETNAPDLFCGDTDP